MSLEVVNLALAGYLAGVIWIVQYVHYPLFARVTDFAPYAAEHAARITPVVGPPMAAQVVVAALLLADGATAAEGVNAALVALVFGSTGLYFGPLHGRLQPALVGRLVRHNWLRTVAWSAQLVVAALLV